MLQNVDPYFWGFQHVTFPQACVGLSFASAKDNTRLFSSHDFNSSEARLVLQHFRQYIISLSLSFLLRKCSKASHKQGGSLAHDAMILFWCLTKHYLIFNLLIFKNIFPNNFYNFYIYTSIVMYKFTQIFAPIEKEFWIRPKLMYSTWL